MSLIGKLKKNKNVQLLYFTLKKLGITVFGEERLIRIKFKDRNGYIPDLNNPKTYNEKIEWLKLNYWQPFYTQCCDKYLNREYIKKKLGKDYAVPCLFACQNVEDFHIKSIKSFPCIIKISNATAENIILHSRDEMSESDIKKKLKKMMKIGELQAQVLSEPQYLKKGEYILVEKLIEDPINGIPNDYKFLYINGKLEFIYCSVERLKRNYRQIYSPTWDKLPFIWVPNANKELFDKFYNLPDVERPPHFDEMKALADIIAQDFPTVRVDFYDTKDEFYIGEITLYHGSGYDAFYPSEYDKIYGEKLILPQKNNLRSIK